MKAAGSSGKNMVCIGFCSGSDACALTTIYASLGKHGIPLVGGTGNQGEGIR